MRCFTAPADRLRRGLRDLGSGQIAGIREPRLGGRLTCAASAGIRSISAWKSCASSTSSLVLRIAVTVPLRLVRCNSAISPKNVPSDEPHLLMRQLDLDLARGDEIHRGGRVAAPHQDFAGLDGLRPQQPHDVGDLGCSEMGEQRHPRQHAPGDHEIAPLHLVGKRGRDDRDRQRDHREPATMAKTETILPSGVTGTTSP